ncbi:MAG: hypothetical protein ACYC9I_02900 [Desulfuromonadales bacterium]
MGNMKVSEVMKRAGFHKSVNKMILKIDLSYLEHCDHIDMTIDYMNSLVQKLPIKSIYGIVDFRGLKNTDEIQKRLNRLGNIIESHFCACALVVNDEQTRTMASSITHRLENSSYQSHEEEHTAEDWLVTQ